MYVPRFLDDKCHGEGRYSDAKGDSLSSANLHCGALCCSDPADEVAESAALRVTPVMF